MMKIWNLGLISYDTALSVQKFIARKHLDALKQGINKNCDTLLLVEHKPVYTVGIREATSEEEILRLRSLGAEFRKTDRGGLITFHGPGQLVAYPVINLKRFKPSVKWYVDSLEETVIRMCGELGIKGQRSPHTGVWVGDNKIAAIGVHTSRYITTHGIALNCDINLNWFKHIDPCGIKDKGVTSLTKETGKVYTIDNTIPKFIHHFQNVFNCTCEELESGKRKEILNGAYDNLLVKEKL